MFISPAVLFLSGIMFFMIYVYFFPLVLLKNESMLHTANTSTLLEAFSAHLSPRLALGPVGGAALLSWCRALWCDGSWSMTSHPPRGQPFGQVQCLEMG